MAMRQRLKSVINSINYKLNVKHCKLLLFGGKLMQFDVLMKYTQKRNETLSVEGAVIKIFFVPIECSGEEKKSHQKSKTDRRRRNPGE